MQDGLFKGDSASNARHTIIIDNKLSVYTFPNNGMCSASNQLFSYIPFIMHHYKRLSQKCVCKS